MNDRNRTFAILEHTQKDGVHWDFLIEEQDALATWQFPSHPLESPLPLAGKRIQDHRKAYLTYEGPVSQDRGTVRRVAEGTVTLNRISEDTWEFSLESQSSTNTYCLGKKEDSWLLSQSDTSTKRNKMDDLNQQSQYWNSVADEKNFTHVMNTQWLTRWFSPDARILDYGCGYGRTLADLKSLGYKNIQGVDTSSAMIARGNRELPGIPMEVVNNLPLHFEENTFDAIVLIAVLTCIPTDEGQQEIANEIKRILKPDGVLYVSDFLLQEDERNRERYKQYAEQYESYGVFHLPEGAVLRHHSHEHFKNIFAGYKWLEEQFTVTPTMNGHQSTCIQFMLQA